MLIIVATTEPQENFKVKNVEPNFSNIGKALGIDIDTISSETVCDWYDRCSDFANFIEDLDGYGYDREAKEIIQNRIQSIITDMDRLKHYVADHSKEIN